MVERSRKQFQITLVFLWVACQGKLWLLSFEIDYLVWMFLFFLLFCRKQLMVPYGHTRCLVYQRILCSKCWSWDALFIKPAGSSCWPLIWCTIFGRIVWTPALRPTFLYGTTIAWVHKGCSAVKYSRKY